MITQVNYLGAFRVQKGTIMKDVLVLQGELAEAVGSLVYTVKSNASHEEGIVLDSDSLEDMSNEFHDDLPHPLRLALLKLGGIDSVIYEFSRVATHRYKDGVIQGLTGKQLYAEWTKAYEADPAETNWPELSCLYKSLQQVVGEDGALELLDKWFDRESAEELVDLVDS